ncbi:F-box protein At3g07870-like [Silene latifolia]|uniref:F-box protein At3g07870-like n=1 Tax=Silene latifolia TaxID=37657 RepID=UPI003D780AF8
MEFNNLPKDIIFDIFSRIPLKPLYKLRIVCKKWQFLLDLSSEFKQFYHQIHKISPILLFKQQNNENPTTQLSSYYIDGTQTHQFSTNFPQKLTSILSCNGILCLISESQALLYDPIIKRYSNLPNSSHFSSTFSWAFGFSSFRNEFRLIHFYTIEKFDNFHYCLAKEVMCEIISYPSSHLGLVFENDWKFLGKCPFNVLGRKDYAFVDGKFYWLIGEKKFNPDCIKIMSFNLEIEIFGIVCFPRSYSNRSVECLDLVEIKGKLCLTDRLPWDSSMNVWMMMKEEEGFSNYWEMKYKIDLMGVLHHDVRILGYLSDKVNDCENDGEILMKIGEESFGLYELGSQLFKELGDGIDNIHGWNLQLMIDRKVLL